MEQKLHLEVLSETIVKNQQQLQHLQHQQYLLSREAQHLGNGRGLHIGIHTEHVCKIDALRQQISIDSR